MQKMPSNHRMSRNVFAHQPCQDIGSLLLDSPFWSHIFLLPVKHELCLPAVLSSSLGESQPDLKILLWDLELEAFQFILVYKSTPFLKAIFKLKRSPYMPWHTVVLQRRCILIRLSRGYEDCQTTVGSTKIVYRGVASKNIPVKGMDPKYILLSKNR